VAMSETMAKKRNDVSVRIDARVYRILKTVAAWEDVPIAEMLSDIVGPVVRKKLAKIQREGADQKPGEPNQEE
jgi:hypothetical protein